MMGTFCPDSSLKWTTNTPSLRSSSESNSRMSDIAVRKKKNADAQAAFRARRANYIATLEETVTSLESVVLQLQDSCREARSQVAELRQENARLRHEYREREKFWRALQAKRSGQGSDPDDIPPLPASYSPNHTHQSVAPSHLSSTHANQFGDDNMSYRTDGSICSPYNSTGTNQTYSNTSSLPYPGANDQISGDNVSHQMNGQRTAGKYGYVYPLQTGSNREGWTNGNHAHVASNGSSHSPVYTSSPTIASPTLTSPTLTSSEMSYAHRYPMEDHKVPLTHNLEGATYVFPNSRSLSPTSSTPPSSSSTSMSSSFQFNFSEGNVPHERSDYDYRRHHGPDVAMHGPAGPDISLAGPGSDALRYRMAAGARRPAPESERAALPSLPAFSGSENGSQHDRSSEGESGPYAQRRERRDTGTSSRSPSPGAPPISGTLAVIKAQAFGALRRTRTRQKKGGDGASRAAMEALESRGLGMGLNVPVGNKRQRLDDDDGDLQ
ncbi:hypothetical protein HWV62_27675 [Athelia sp. TMB]|nr:hypothetical protein HWV62_27675 [Athelia sp. TMB]